MRFFSQKRIQSLDFILLIFLLVFGLFATSAFAQEPTVFAESFYTLLMHNDDDEIMEGLGMCSTRFRAALTRTGQYQERASRETEELVSSCNRDRSSPEYIEQCVLEQTQNTVDLVLILSAQSIRRRGFIFEAQMTSTLDETTIWGDSFHIEDEDIIILAAQEACNQLAIRLVETLNMNSFSAINSHVNPSVLVSEQTAPEGFVLLPAGSFMMGSPNNESGRDNDERQHEVTITHPFYMQTHEVTQGEWETLMENNPSYFSSSGDGANCGSDCPVETVNWWEALAYANALSNSEGLEECYVLSGCENRAGNDMECTDVLLNSDCGYRLPTEAEWEYAARAGTRTAFYSGERTPDDIAWHGEDWNTGSTHQVGQLEANSWGLYDMSGNVFEWCWDWYGSYESSPVTDPMGPDSGSPRVLRGGAWIYSYSSVRSARRYFYSPNNRRRYSGFRLVYSAP